jgi:hypothetical protein
MEEDKMNRRTGLLVILVVLLALSGCAAAQTASDDGYLYRESSNMGAPEMEAPVMESAPMAPQLDSKAYENAAGGISAGMPPAAIDRMVIRNADMAIIVDDPAVVIDQIAKLAEGMGGFVVSSTTYQTYNSQGLQVPEGNVTIRVPAEKLNSAMDAIVGYTSNPAEDVTRKNVSGQDVTQSYTDLASRLRNLEDAEEQLRAIMDQAYKTEDVLSVFNQLTSIRSEIEVIKGQMQYYEEAAALSAISVTVQARAIIAPITIAGWTPVGVARNAIQALVEAGQFIATAAIWLVLWALPVALMIGLPLFLIVWAIRKAIRGRRRPAKIVPAE